MSFNYKTAAVLYVRSKTPGVDARETLAGPTGSDAHAFRFPFAQGELLCGKYIVDTLLGFGASTFVVSARRIGLNDEVALKFMRPTSFGVEGAAARFAELARAVVGLQGEFIARVFAVEHLPDGTPFIVGERLDGENLSQRLAVERSLPSELVATYALQICAGLATAHAVGVVHCSIRPSNIFLARQPQGSELIKLLDFGISRAALDPDALSSLRYASPEWMRAWPDIDARTDIWSLGCVLYELLSGTAPFDAPTSIQVCAGVLEGEPTALSSVVPGIPSELSAIIRHCLAKDRQLRFQSIDALSRALQPFAPVSALASVVREPDVQERFPAEAQWTPPSAALDEAQGLRSATGAPTSATLPQTSLENPSMFSPLEPARVEFATELPPASEPVAEGSTTPVARSWYDRRWALPLLAAVLVALAVWQYRRVPAHPVLRSAATSHSVSSTPTLRPAPIPAPGARVETSEARAVVPSAPVATAPEQSARQAERWLRGVAAPGSTASASAPRRVSHRDRSNQAKPLAPVLPATEPAAAAAPEASAAAIGGNPLETRRASAAVPGPQPADGALEPSTVVPGQDRAAIAGAATVTRIPAALSARPAPSAAPRAAAPGSIDPRAVTAVIRSHANAVQECFDRAQMDHPNLRGRMTFRASVDRRGNVTNAWADKQLDDGARLTACILTLARDWKFPPPAGDASGSVSYAFVFD
jgi:eukaryotic-like serine/threonine-protein kinase